ncbi:MAG: formate dehydrogenase accessory sulfurtransferase FdhD [Flavobacteriales bacterium]|nr:formate dehydrogenase accessory sulfurtransferase FdhD [Flavobacteriales bacterium]
MQTNTYEGLHIVNKTQSITSDELVVEAPLQININNEAYTVVMRTPDNDQDLVLGLLYAEDIYKKSLPIPFEIVEEKYGIPSVINVSIAPDVLGKGYLNKRTLLSVSSCGICGKQQLEDIEVSVIKLRKKYLFHLKAC